MKKKITKFIFFLLHLICLYLVEKLCCISYQLYRVFLYLGMIFFMPHFSLYLQDFWGVWSASLWHVMQNLAKDTGEMVVLLHRSRKYLTLSTIFYLYKWQIRPKMAHCIHIWPEVAKSPLSSFDSVQNRFHRLVGIIYFPPYILFPTNTVLQTIQ